MLQNKNIAVFIDVDNCALSYDSYKNAIDQINSMGKVVSCKLYGVSDRRHKEIILDANDNGYDVALTMRVKKRNSRVFDNRILVDVVEKVVSNTQIDAVAVVCAPADMVYLYRFLKKREVSVIALDNTDEDSVKLVAEILDLGQVQVLKFPQQKPQKTVDDVLEESVAQPMTAEEKNAQLLDEIARLREENGIVLPSQEPIDEPQPVVEEVLDEPVVEQTTVEDDTPVAEQTTVEDDAPVDVEEETLGGQAQSLLDEIEQLRAESTITQPEVEEVVEPTQQEVEEVAPVQIQQPEDVVQEDVCEQVAPAKDQSQPETSTEDATPVEEDAKQDLSEDQLIAQIENLRANLSDESNDEELIAQIKSLLDGLE